MSIPLTSSSQRSTFGESLESLYRSVRNAMLCSASRTDDDLPLETINMTATTTDRPPLRVAYITDIFPLASFIHLEIKKLRHLGMHIDLYVIWNSPQRARAGEEKSISKETQCLSPPRIWQLFRAHCYYAWKVPHRYYEILKLCLAEHTHIRLRRRTLFNFLLAPYLAAGLEKKHLPHIHAHFAFGAATTAMMASRLLNIGFSFTAHRGDILEEKTLLNEKVKRANFVIAISQYNKKVLLREAPETESRKIKTIHLGVDTKVFLPCPQANQGPPVLLAVGYLLARKGHEYLIEACRLLKARGIAYRCVIVGEGPKRKELENLIHRYNMEREVELAGSAPHESIQRYYNRADIFVHPALSEGIPVVLMEAMSKGLPVIATRITGVPELVQHEENGILVSPANVVELIEGMTRLLKDKEFRTRLGNNATRTIVQRFNIDVNALKVKKCFEEELCTITAEMRM